MLSDEKVQHIFILRVAEITELLTALLTLDWVS